MYQQYFSWKHHIQYSELSLMSRERISRVTCGKTVLDSKKCYSYNGKHFPATSSSIAKHAKDAKEANILKSYQTLNCK